MFASSNQYSVYVTASGTDATRRATLSRLMVVQPLSSKRQATFVAGERTLLRDDVSENEAQQMATDLRTLGLRVDVEARDAGFEAVGLDGFSADEAPRAKPLADNPFFNVSAGLVGLDGEDAPREDAPTLAPATGVDSLKGLFGGGGLRDADEALSVDEPPPRRRADGAPPPVPRASSAPPPLPRPVQPAPRPPARPPAPAAPAPRFRPEGDGDGAFELALDRAPQTEFQRHDVSAAEDVLAVRRCPRHDLPMPNGRCSMCDAADEHMASRLFKGELRRKPAVRLGIGLGAGIALGWLVTLPMARHGEMKVANVREQATREHTRPTEEAAAHAAELDAQADELSQDAFVHTFGTWALITGAVTALWMRLT